MKKSLLIILFNFLVLFIYGRQPKLVIGIVVDQMRYEYLYRFEKNYTSQGFKKLLKKGYTYANMHYNYMPTYTAPGHASLYTGSTPSDHGIVANDWYDRTTKKKVYCTEDKRYTTLGEMSTQGNMSPANLIATTITDQLKLYTQQKAKVFGVSIKDRGAILPAGHFANAAYWLSDQGNFISSSYYFKQMPQWVTDFNEKKLWKSYLNQWNTLVDISQYTESGEDNSPFEAPVVGNSPVFPYNLIGAKPKIIKTTPYGNDILIDFAKELIEKEQLGKDEVLDFLSLSFSSTDYIGHLYGLQSKEIQDTYVRLDKNIASLLSYLDKAVGKDNYLLFLTADHAVAENSAYLKSLGYPIQPLDEKQIEEDIQKINTKAKQKWGIDVYEYAINQNIYLNHENINKKGIAIQEIVNFLISEIEDLPYVKKAYHGNFLSSGFYVNTYAHKLSNGYYTQRSGDIVILFQPGQYIMEYGDTGTTHGSPYNYDTHVPCIFYGSNIPTGNSFDYKVITQISPTLSALFNIPYGNTAHNLLLTEIIKKK